MSNNHLFHFPKHIIFPRLGRICFLIACLITLNIHRISLYPPADIEQFLKLNAEVKQLPLTQQLVLMYQSIPRSCSHEEFTSSFEKKLCANTWQHLQWVLFVLTSPLWISLGLFYLLNILLQFIYKMIHKRIQTQAPLFIAHWEKNAKETFLFGFKSSYVRHPQFKRQIRVYLSWNSPILDTEDCIAIYQIFGFHFGVFYTPNIAVFRPTFEL